MDTFFYSTDLDYYKLVEDLRRMFAHLSEERFVDELVFCGLDRTRIIELKFVESYEEFLYKKLFERLHNLYSEKNAIELLSGDYDKKKNKKKKGKKKSQNLKESKKDP